MPDSIFPDKAEENLVRAPAADISRRVYVIDDESEVRRSLHILLSTAGLVSWPFASARDFLDNLDGLAPAPILLDIRMPEIDGIELITILHERAINWPIIIVTGHGQIQVAVQAMKLGAIEFLEKPFEFEALEHALQTAFTQLSAVNDTAAIREGARKRFNLLSSREMEVMSVLMQGIPNKAAAHQLSLSVRTVEMHRANALAKLNVKSMAEVVRLASDAQLPLEILDRSHDDPGK
jgi:two-component system, LuxR family, response regulator FixJ